MIRYIHVQQTVPDVMAVRLTKTHNKPLELFNIRYLGGGRVEHGDKLPNWVMAKLRVRFIRLRKLPVAERADQLAQMGEFESFAYDDARGDWSIRQWDQKTGGWHYSMYGRHLIDMRLPKLVTQDIDGIRQQAVT